MILYTTLVQMAIEDMARAVPALRHIDPRRLLVVAASRVSSSRYGALAQCYALREAEKRDLSYWYYPSTRRVVRATTWFQQKNTPIEIRGTRMLYLIMLRLPRLLGHDPIETVIHELIHIGPDFDGRMHRLRHGKRFNRIVEACAAQWRARGDPSLIEALENDYEALTERWGSLAGQSFATRLVSRRLCPLPDPPPPESHPDFCGKGLIFDPKKVEIIEPKWTPKSVPERLNERNLLYRVYTPRRAERISGSALHSAKTLFPERTADLSSA